MSNTGFIHGECADNRLKEWQEKNANTKIEVGNYVKMKFIQEDKEPEWMWVEISNVIGKDDFEGCLANDPLKLTNIKCGDKVQVKRSNISQLLEK
jgi:uncharacterized protein YegJ (DUF2314 family)